MNINEFAQRKKSILSVFEQSQNDLITLNTEIDKAIEVNMQEFDRIRKENENLLDMKSENQKALKFFGKLFLEVKIIEL